MSGMFLRLHFEFIEQAMHAASLSAHTGVGRWGWETAFQASHFWVGAISRR